MKFQRWKSRLLGEVVSMLTKSLNRIIMQATQLDSIYKPQTSSVLASRLIYWCQRTARKDNQNPAVEGNVTREFVE